MNAVLLYDEFELGSRANAMLSRAANRAEAAVPLSINPWRLDMLMLPPTGDGALKEATTAHLIVLAVRSQTEISPGLLQWLDTWAERREVQDAALAVFEVGKGGTLSTTAVPELSRLAARHGLSFILGEPLRTMTNRKRAPLPRRAEARGGDQDE